MADHMAILMNKVWSNKTWWQEKVQPLLIKKFGRDAWNITSHGSDLYTAFDKHDEMKKCILLTTAKVTPFKFKHEQRLKDNLSREFEFTRADFGTHSTQFRSY